MPLLCLVLLPLQGADPMTFEGGVGKEERLGKKIIQFNK